VPALKRTLRKLAPPAAALLLTTAALAANLTGVVTDRTTGNPSAGDTVAVINTAQGMDEIAHATTASSGRFTVAVPDGGQILLHITHAGAEYFKSVPPGSASVTIDVYDSAPKIPGITGEALVLRAETDPSGRTLNVTENFFLQNASAPPRTQYGGNTFDFYLPKGAAVTESLAVSPGGLPTNVNVVPVSAATGQYAFTFPIRPGETRLQVAYTMPYSGSQPFAIKLSVPTGDVAVMLPRAMQFRPTTPFQPINPDPNSQAFDAHSPPFAQPVQFAISGAGQLPQETQAASQGPSQPAASPSTGAGQPTTSASDTRPGGGLGTPIDPEDANDPWSKYKWWVLGLLGLALAAGAGVMLKAGQPIPVVATAGAIPADPTAPVAPSSPADPSAALSFILSSRSAAEGSASVLRPTSPSPLLQTLKDELFSIETDRLSGRLSEAEYTEHKAALDLILRRALKSTSQQTQAPAGETHSS
jgi:hypothetical protein